MGLQYARLPVEEEGDLRWAFRRRAVSGNCLSLPAARRNRPCEAGRGDVGEAGVINLRLGHLYRRPRQDGESTDKWMISMSFSKLSLVTLSEAALIAAGGGLAAWYSPQLDLPAIVGVVLLARFRGRVQSLIGAFSFSLLVLVSAIVSPRFAHSHTGLVQLLAAICAIWFCAYFASGTKANANPPLKWENPLRAQVNVWETVLTIFPGWMWLARPDGTPEFASPAALSYTGLAQEEALTEPLCIRSSR